MRTLKEKVTIFLATGGLIGFSPVAPGTFGSLAAIPLCWLLSLVRIETAFVLLSILIGFSISIAHAAEKVEAEKDPKQVVIDEICGMAVTLFALPFTPIVVICGFALFRLFDILKPFPIRWAERKFKGGLGVVLDDLLAGFVAHFLLRLGMILFSVA